MMWAWWQRRSRRLTAVVGLGGNGPRFRTVSGIRSRSSFVGGGDEPEEELAAGVVDWSEADFVKDE
jgi:hypothetical protein